METITNAVNTVTSTATSAVNTVTTTASKAIWGEPADKDNVTEGKEPISGEKGNVKAGEPYDKGNDDNATTSISSTTAKATELPSTAAHTETSPVAGASTTTTSPSATKDTTIAPGSVTAPVGDARDDKTKAATQAALVSLQHDTKNLTLNDKATSGDGLVSAKRVDEGKGAKTGVRSDLSAPAATEPIGLKNTTEKSLFTDKNTTTASSSTPVAPLAGTTPKTAEARKSTSSSSSEEVDTATGQKKKKLSLKDKIKAKLHKH